MSNEYYFPKDGTKHLAELKELVPDTYEAFSSFSKTALQEGALSAKTKELIAVAVTHITRCPYCATSHVNNAKKLGATEQEIAEATMVAAAMNAWASVIHSIVAWDAITPEHP